MDMMDKAKEDNLSIVPWKRREGKGWDIKICVSLSTVTLRSAFPTVLPLEQIKNNIFLNQMKNYFSFFLS